MNMKVPWKLQAAMYILIIANNSDCGIQEPCMEKVASELEPKRGKEGTV